MNIKTFIGNLFDKKSPSSTSGNQRLRDGLNAFQRGQEFYVRNETAEALRYFDTALALGFENVDLFASRGSCLGLSGFNLDAIDNFDRAIQLDPNDSNLYFMRAVSKGSIADLEGRINDLHLAIKIASIDNAANRSHNIAAKQQGYEGGVVEMFQTFLAMAKWEIKNYSPDDPIIQERRASARRRPRL